MTGSSCSLLVLVLVAVGSTDTCCSLIGPPELLGDCRTLCPLRSPWFDGAASQCVPLDGGAKGVKACAPPVAMNGTRCAYLSGFPKSSTSFGTWFVASLLRSACEAEGAARCHAAEALGAPPYALRDVGPRDWADSDGGGGARAWTGMQAAAFVRAGARGGARENATVVFTQQCTKHAKFWAGNAAKFQALDLVVPLRDPREYGMSREAFDLSEGVGSGLWSADEKQRRLREAFGAMEGKLQFFASRLRAPPPAGGGMLMYLKDTLEVAPEAVARQVVDFFALRPFLDRGRDADGALAAAVARATRVPDAKRDEHAWSVKHSAGDKAAHGTALCEWYGARGWADVRALWAEKAAEGALTVALFPWERLPCGASFGDADIDRGEADASTGDRPAYGASEAPAASDVLDTSIWPGANDEWTNVGVIGFLAVFLTVFIRKVRLSPPHETSGSH